VEAVHLLRSALIVEQREVALLQVGNVVAVLVSDGEDEIDFVDAEVNDSGRLIGLRLAGGRRSVRAVLPVAEQALRRAKMPRRA